VTRIVVDASIAVKWFLPEELFTEAHHLLAPEYELLAPDLIWAELGNVLWKKHRRGEIDAGTARRLLQDFSRMPIEFQPAGRWIEAALDLAIRLGVTVYDALYLAVAAGNGCRLMTGDRRLHDACRDDPLTRHLVVRVADLR
jgi:predicted nucleic acid-binding protein